MSGVIRGLIPRNHFPGDCVTCCTNTLAWDKGHYDYLSQTACVACHRKDDLIDHYNAICPHCLQNSANWNNLQIDHSQYPYVAIKIKT